MKKNIILSAILGVILFSSSTSAGSIFKYISEIVINNGYTQEIIDGIEYNGDLYINIEDLSKYGNQNIVYDHNMSTLKINDHNTSGKYEGEYLNDFYHGEGKMIFSNGDIYEGQFKKGVIEGEGTMYYSNGGLYIGSWKSGKPEGKGEFHWIGGKSYIGKFNQGFITGAGSMYYPNEDKYVGDFEYGFKSGRGQYYFQSGDFYDGMWKYDLYDGEGILTSGKVRKIGVWERGQFKERKLLNELLIEID